MNDCPNIQYFFSFFHDLRNQTACSNMASLFLFSNFQRIGIKKKKKGSNLNLTTRSSIDGMRFLGEMSQT